MGFLRNLGAVLLAVGLIVLLYGAGIYTAQLSTWVAPVALGIVALLLGWILRRVGLAMESRRARRV